MATNAKPKRTEAGLTGLTEEEKAAARETVAERKRQAKQAGNREAGLKDIEDKIAEMPKADRDMAERIHEIVLGTAPDLVPRTWYGMPAYANKEGKIVCFFKSAAKFKSRYATFGFEEDAMIDDGSMWATSWAITKLTADDEKNIAALVKKAVE